MNVIEVKNFNKSYGAMKVHDNLNFHVQRGECLGLIGGSGAGKSVILRSLIGLEKPDSGQVFIEGEEITHWNEVQLTSIRIKVAYVFQNGALFDSMSVFDNLAYPLREHTRLSDAQIRERIAEVLEDFGLTGVESVYPAELSGGMQKRIGLARSIIMNPNVILYDEPTAGLDPYNTIMIQNLIAKLRKRGTTSVFVTHDMASAMAVCDRIALLQDGHIAAQGTLENLKNDPHGPLQRFMKGKKIEEKHGV